MILDLWFLSCPAKVLLCWTICDQAPLNEALWGEYQNWEKYLIVINTIFDTFWCKNDYSVTFLSKVTKCWTLECRISSKIALQRYGLSKIVIYVYFSRPIKNKMFHNTSFLPQFHWKKCLSWLSLVWWIFRKNI